jgi:hypothetical protein
MDDSRIRRRLFVAERILSTYDGQAKAQDVLAEMDDADFNDPVLEELLDLFQHEPAKSRVWGLWGAAYDAYIARGRALAAAVLAEPHAVPRSPKDN